MASNIQNIGLQGIHKGLSNIAEKADRISRAFTPENTDDPTADIVAMKLDEFQVKASSKVIKVGDELEKSVLDILA
jgi:hypothetical protein